MTEYQTIRDTPCPPPATVKPVSQEQDTDKLLADLRERISARLDACGEHTAAGIVDETHIRAPVKPVSPFGCECWTIGDHSKVGAEGKWQRSLGNNICCTIRHDAQFCELCGHARTPVVSQGESR